VFFLNHPPVDSILKPADMCNIFHRMTADRRTELAFEIVKKEIDLEPAKLLQLKDQSQVSEEGIKLWINHLPGLTCSFTEMKKWKEELKTLYEASLIPRNTPDGRAINFKRLVEFLKIAYPWMANVQEILGVNVDATVLGGEDLTSGSLRFLNDQFRVEVDKANSRKHEWFFALYEGKDERLSISQNVFLNDQEGY